MLKVFLNLKTRPHSPLTTQKASYRYSPAILTENRRRQRVSASTDFLNKVSRSATFLDQIITGDELWLHFIDPDTGQRRRTYCTIFWNRFQHLSVDFLPPDTYLTGQAYASQVEKLHENMEKSYRRMLSKDRLLLHDNCSQHTCRATKTMMRQCGLIQLFLPPYSPDLAPSDYHLFPKLRKHLRRETPVGQQQLKVEVNEFLCGLKEDFYSEGLTSLPHRHRMCIQADGDYFTELH